MNKKDGLEDIKNSYDPSEEEIPNNLEATKEELNNETDKEGEKNEGNQKDLLNKKEQELEDLNNRYIRLQADFNNYKKRIEKEKESLFSYATQELVTQLLPVIDNFERALLTTDESEKDIGFYKGMEMIYKQILDILLSNGLQEIGAVGQKFDPNVHHGVAQEESEDHEEDTVIEVFQKGYKLKDRVIRPSMVKISK